MPISMLAATTTHPTANNIIVKNRDSIGIAIKFLKKLKASDGPMIDFVFVLHLDLGDDRKHRVMPGELSVD